MIQHLSLLNPFGRIEDTARATAAARGSAVALAASGLLSAWGAVKILLWPETITRLMHESMAAQAHDDPEAARIAEAMIPAMMNMSAMFAAVFAAGLLALAVVQWRYLTRTIPIIFVCLGVLGLLSAAAGLLMTSSGMAPDVPLPVAEVILGRTVSIAAVLLHISGFKGGNFLARHREG